MKTIVDILRENTQQTISQNPVEITIDRTTKSHVDGAIQPQTSTVGPFIVRIFRKSQAAMRHDDDNAGRQDVDKWMLLADWLADIQATSTVEDMFEVLNYGRFRILRVFPQRFNQEIIGYQAEIERVE